MTDRSDALLIERFAALANPIDDSDWLDVRRRARRGGRRRWLALPLAAALAALIAGSALGLHRPIVDFFTAEPAPERVVVEFGRLSVSHELLGGRADVLPGQARKVMEAEIQGAKRSLYVAPRKSGGFCWTWPDLLTNCVKRDNLLGFSGLYSYAAAQEQAVIGGHVLPVETQSLEVRYEDGRRDTIPLLWVSAPIDAGFFVFEIPHEHLPAGHRPDELVALDRDGDELAHRAFLYPDPRHETGRDGLPLDADRSRKRTLFDFRDAFGRRWTLVVAPAPGGRSCFAYNGGGACLSARFPESHRLGVQGGGNTVNVCCTVPAEATTVELRFQDGVTTELEPIERFLLYVIPPAHYPRGHRLERITARDRSGAIVSTSMVETDRRGIYPCTDEDKIELGYGATICP